MPMPFKQAISNVLAIYERAIQSERQQPSPTPAHDGPDTRMRAIGPETGVMLNTLVRSLETPVVLELGTSYGYSTIWLAEAARAAGGRVITMEYHDYKSEFAQKMAADAGLTSYIDFRVGDALELIPKLSAPLNFVFVDLWKDLYEPCLEAFYPKLAPGSIITADNMLRPASEGVKRYQHAIRAKPGITSVLLPVGTGVEVSRYHSE